MGFLNAHFIEDEIIHLKLETRRAYRRPEVGAGKEAQQLFGDRTDPFGRNDVIRKGIADNFAAVVGARRQRVVDRDHLALRIYPGSAVAVIPFLVGNSVLSDIAQLVGRILVVAEEEELVLFDRATEGTAG